MMTDEEAIKKIEDALVQAFGEEVYASDMPHLVGAVGTVFGRLLGTLSVVNAERVIAEVRQTALLKWLVREKTFDSRRKETSEGDVPRLWPRQYLIGSRGSSREEQSQPNVP